MQIDVNSAAVDNDFFNHALEITKRTDAEIIQILQGVFQDLAVTPIMHPLVYAHEVLKDHNLVKHVFNNGIIKLPTLEDIHKNEADKISYYSYLVCELYQKMFGVPLALGGRDVFSYWKSSCSLGEIHSVAMCLICNCGVFLSDDKGSKRLQNIIQDYFASKIIVYNRQDVRKVLIAKEHLLSNKDLKVFAHSKCN